METASLSGTARTAMRYRTRHRARINNLPLLVLSAWPEQSRTTEAALTLLGLAMNVVRTVMAAVHNHPQP